MYYYQNIIVALDLVLPILAAITVHLRFQARKTQKQSLRSDDWVILLTLAFTLANAILCIYAVYVQNYGNLLTSYTYDQRVFNFKFLYVDVILVILILGLIKISVLLLYKRIFTHDIFIKVANVYLGICIAWTIAGVLSAIFRSNPISAYWENMGETSYNFGVWNISMAVLDIVLDLSILALPIPVISGLHISTRRKLSVMAIFLLGIFCVVSSAVRLYYAKSLNEVDSSPLFIFKFPEAATYITNSAALWSHIECSASIITANLPTLVPVARKFQVVSQSMRTWLSTSLLGSSSRGTDHDKQSSLPEQASSMGLSNPDAHSDHEMNDRIKVNTTYTVSAV